MGKLTKGKVKKPEYVLNTHWHFDHTGGNAAFGREGSIVAHKHVRTRLMNGLESAALGMKIPPAPKEALPRTGGRTLGGKGTGFGGGGGPAVRHPTWSPGSRTAPGAGAGVESGGVLP